MLTRYFFSCEVCDVCVGHYSRAQCKIVPRTAHIRFTATVNLTFGFQNIWNIVFPRNNSLLKVFTKWQFRRHFNARRVRFFDCRMMLPVGATGTVITSIGTEHPCSQSFENACWLWWLWWWRRGFPSQRYREAAFCDRSAIFAALSEVNIPPILQWERQQNRN